jgi:tetratricopeptide (TPR) repeat protein
MLLHDWTDELHDFADTAALIEALDLVITVDTAVAHVAGSLGKPVWILNRFDQCWRWLRDRTDSPWYPSARLFQQRTQGDWAGVIHDVVEALRQSPTAPDDAFARATALHQQFRLAEAEIIYRAIPPHHPDHAEARHRLGIIALQTGRLENAVDLIGEAIALNPNDAAALSNRGTALADLGRFEEAVASFDRAIVAQPGNAVMHCNRGTALWKMGRHEDALADFDRAIELKPDHAEAYSNRGAALADLDRAQEALDSCDKAIELNPDHAESYYNRGNALRYLKRPDAALLSYDKAIELRPNHAALYNNRGLALTDLGRHDEAVASFDKAIALQPDHAEAHNNRGIALSYLGQPEAALANYDAAIALKPDYAEAHRNRGDVLAELGRPEAALTNYDRAITLKPDLTEAYWNQSLCRLMIGDYETGWKLYEWRWKAGLARARPELPEPPWLGETPIDGKTILVHAEQGFGDAIQFCRYLPMLAERATVILDVRRPLSRLLSRLPGVSRVITFEDTLPPFDAWIPMMSLPLVFNTTLATIPDSVPYLTADPKQTAIWKQRLAAFPGRKAGLVWAGSRRHENLNSKAVDGRRSMSLRQFAPLAGISGLTLISLQKGGPAAQASTAGVALHDWTAELNDFADTAALIEALDLVISVDTAVVHLAGALGKPVWVLNRYDQDWRWLRNRTDSPWYPTARLFRQHSLGDWSGVIEDLVAALRAAE